jgi:hypothetical protein
VAPGPASVRCLAVLRLFLPVLERGERGPEVAEALGRVRRGIALLEGSVADQPSDPWAYLEYFLNACLLRLGWTNGWEGLGWPSSRRTTSAAWVRSWGSRWPGAARPYPGPCRARPGRGASTGGGG